MKISASQGRSRAARGPIRRSSVSARDLVSEALAGVLQRPARSALTTLGTVLGVGAFIAVLGLTGTAASQIDARFNELTATEVSVEDTGGTDADRLPLSFPRDADARITRLNGVKAAGVSWKVRLGPERPIRATPRPDDTGTGAQTPLVAGSPGLLPAAGARVTQGRLFDAYHERHRQQVAVVGSATAARLGIMTLETQPAVFVENTPFTVIGIIDDVDRRPGLLMSVVIPRSTAEQIFGPPSDVASLCS